MAAFNRGSRLIRLFRRVGRFAVAMVATVAFLAGGGIVLLVLSVAADAFPEFLKFWIHALPVAFSVACGCSVGVFLLFDRFGLLPDDDSDPPTALGLGSVRRRK